MQGKNAVFRFFMVVAMVIALTMVMSGTNFVLAEENEGKHLNYRFHNNYNDGKRLLLCRCLF